MSNWMPRSISFKRHIDQQGCNDLSLVLAGVGMPEEIITDQRTYGMSKNMKQVCWC